LKWVRKACLCSLNLKTSIGKSISWNACNNSAPELDDVESRAAALAIATIYNGMEKILLRVMKMAGKPRPSGKNWHADLLDGAFRNGVLSEATKDEMKKLMAFRHFVRHAYSFEIKAEIFSQAMNEIEVLVSRFKSEIQQLMDG
jgi:uncharacterized protein YutE (UPF0331/DUF86 family)